MLRIVDEMPLWLVLLAVLSVGLAPFAPEPHVWQKLRMLASGDLRRGIDILDLCLHGTPWLVLLAKLGRLAFLASRR
ncbi:hypothetical protein EV663_10348 [Rhodovulum bhavnagarense]|uniref:RND transporter n=1 Tax=Rhodovulum bhavnagarense TaxID=992286 RepID=A0A4R2RG15_9RHOB|nr:RND transporter [Rhodovulum bhavnagarense]TCP61863.1 hypothetical protein EV663_10348 [Rhodovulum bhavnagarense]